MQFRTKARAVDLLGKGQIADLPTAITELWKNGYDAYADKLEAILYTNGYEDVNSPFLVLSDNGKGMSGEDLENKWLILGTDSKSRNNPPEKGIETLWKDIRPIMGEKGIGRLSVSYLGSPMLMLTKRIGFPLQALYFDWRTLENYNLFLDHVNIPKVSINSLDNFYISFDFLKREFLKNFYSENQNKKIAQKETETKLGLWNDQTTILNDILKGTKELELPSFFLEEIVKELIGDSDEIHGTKFIIFEPNEQFLLLKKWASQHNNSDDQSIETIEDIRTGLVGFYNEFKYNNDNKSLSTSFILKDNTGERDFIGTSTFFTLDDFNNCDHLIDGEFDEYGTFTGEIKIYNQVVNDYEYRPNKPANQKTSYGKFKLKLGYVPGKEFTMLEDNVFKYIDTKLKTSGGLYIYRDNLRVLPYGRPHADFLQFEEKRSRRAGSYFFSYRRMFGYVDLTRKDNSSLIDKAGREGFINNKAHREFKTDLTALFIDLAKEYFGTDAKQDIKEKQFNEHKEVKASEAEEKKLEKEERSKFKLYLKEIPIELQVVTSKFKTIGKELKKKLKDSSIIYQDIQFLLREIDKLKGEIENLEPKKPKRFTMDSRDRERFEEVVEIYNAFKIEFNSISEIRNEALTRIEEEQLLKEYENRFHNYASLLNDITIGSKSALARAFENIDIEFEKTENSFKNNLDKIYQENLPTPPSRENLEKSLQNLEFDFSDLRLKYQTVLDAKSDHLLRINFEIDDDALVGYYKDRYERTLKELGDFKSLAQLGISVEIINHELNTMYSQLSTSISEIKKYLKETREAEKHYKYLKNAFEHLDTKYQSLNPLYRKSKRTKKYIKGAEIKDYLKNFFEETFKEEKIKFHSTILFDNSEIFTFESVILPVFVNVINNAIYWVRSSNNPEILLDYEFETKTIIICNNGTEIKQSKLEEIFELFYTRRDKGRGIGLYLSKDSLNTVGLDIKATNEPRYNKLNGASFIIRTNI
jgi:signal transduction histidine kinase